MTVSAVTQCNAAKSSNSSFTLSELVLSNFCGQNCDQLLLPMIAQLSNTINGWVTIFSDRPIDKHSLKRFGANTTRVRVVPCSITKDKLWLLWETLHCGSSGCVISECSKLTKEELSHLQKASTKGRCQTLLWRQAE